MIDNTRRFSGRANLYDRFRQRYPAPEVLAHLRQWCGLTPAWRVADIGAGTGMLAEIFLANGNPVTAVEPNPEMRAHCEAMTSEWPRLSVLGTTAEATGLPDRSVDLVAAGRAFHWFDRQRALAEFRRIGKPGAWLVILALSRTRETDDAAVRSMVDEYEGILASHGTDYVRVREGYGSYEAMETLLPGKLYRAQLPGERNLDWETFLGVTRSLSYSPQPADPRYPAFQRELQLYFDRHARDGILTQPTTCWINAAQIA